ncbi:SEL1-like repeat protein [Sphingobium agri]|uniref:SEL1-like repeat protein n=1 Tax=Sphingobium agri TaxID=2933566 RepID=A0ABT0DUD9_9SPHN|nr:SEL1-like repeat protein [Sphingobium agri]MCK0530674.1 SEL1-like repeat protein [Sphingobium agri]
MGISFAPGRAPLDLQGLAKRAQSGEKQAQLDLGVRFEEGQGVVRDLERAAKLYSAAGSSGGGSRMVYVPVSGKRARAMTMPLSSGMRAGGLPEAGKRLEMLTAKMARLAPSSADVAEQGIAYNPASTSSSSGSHRYANEIGIPLALSDLENFDSAFAECQSRGIKAREDVLDIEDAEGRTGRGVYAMRKCVASLLVQTSQRSFWKKSACNFRLIQSASPELMKGPVISVDSAVSRYGHDFMCSIGKDPGHIQSKTGLNSNRMLVSDVMKLSRYGVDIGGHPIDQFLNTLCRASIVAPSPGGSNVDALEERICVAWRPTSAAIRGRR